MKYLLDVNVLVAWGWFDHRAAGVARRLSVALRKRLECRGDQLDVVPQALGDHVEVSPHAPLRLRDGGEDFRPELPELRLRRQRLYRRLQLRFRRQRLYRRLQVVLR